MRHMDKSNVGSRNINVAKDLLTIIEDCKPLDGSKRVVTVDDLMMSVIDETLLMTKLSSYVTRYGHLAFNHGHKVGEADTLYKMGMITAEERTRRLNGSKG